MPATRLIALLGSPGSVSGLADSHWNGIVEQGRKTQLLGQLAAKLQRLNLLDAVPGAVRRHLELAVLTATRRVESALWEIATMRRGVNQAIPLVLLKGCAYVACGDNNGIGRLFSDIDILVPRQALSMIETDLFSTGWKPSRVNNYDSAYYRNWMHEVPPMEHVRRHTVVDLHHAINPPVSRYYINPEKLFERLVEIGSGIFVLDATDRVVHCAVHLLQEGEPRKLLRDLYDLHLLLLQHHGSPAGLERLRHRARELGVLALVETAMGAASSLFGDTRRARPWFQSCVSRAALEANRARSTMAGGITGATVLAHAHLIKMPVRLLVPHLLRKSLARMRPDSDAGS